VTTDEAVHRFHQVVVDHEQQLPKRHLGRAKHRQGDGSDQQRGRYDGKDTLRNHMNSFSFFRSV
jgi:hypothetical protein